MKVGFWRSGRRRKTVRPRGGRGGRRGRRMGCIKNEGRRQRSVIGRWGMAKIKNKHFPKKEIKEEMLSKGL